MGILILDSEYFLQGLNGIGQKTALENENLGKLLKVPGTSNNFFETFKIKNHIKFSDHPQYDNNIFVILSVLPGWSLFSGLWRIGAVERDSRQWRSPELQDQEGRKEKDKLDNINFGTVKTIGVGWEFFRLPSALWYRCIPPGSPGSQHGGAY